jgi:hypothetical protein
MFTFYFLVPSGEYPRFSRKLLVSALYTSHKHPSIPVSQDISVVPEELYFAPIPSAISILLKIIDFNASVCRLAYGPLFSSGIGTYYITAANSLITNGYIQVSPFFSAIRHLGIPIALT